MYKAKGYSDDWIEKRMRGIAIREELTDKWEKRGINEQKDYAILTAEISKATFGMTPSEYKEYKNLKRENLRDHMTDLELIFSMLVERSTAEISQVNNTHGFDNLVTDAQEGEKLLWMIKMHLKKRLAEKWLLNQIIYKRKKIINLYNLNRKSNVSL